MRTVVAQLVAVVLLSLLAVCPLAACAHGTGSNAVTHGCCHKSPLQPVRCPMPALQDCPYFILEKAKTTQAAVGIAPIVLQRNNFEPALANQFSNLRGETRLPNSKGLYLRTRVLLI